MHQHDHAASDCHYHQPAVDGADSFTVAMPRLTFGRGCLRELGERAAQLGMKQVALFSGKQVMSTYAGVTATESLQRAGIEYTLFDEIRIEPDDNTVRNASAFLGSGNFDGIISLGGGSVIDVTKAAMASVSTGHDVCDFFAPPIGQGTPINKPRWPHIACPTTSGTGSECTSVSVIRVTELNCKFVFASPYLLPDVALVDPACCDSLPGNAIGSTGFDLLCHALESYTARAYVRHAKITDPAKRQYIQGANPFSDTINQEALRRVGAMLERGVSDATDHEARDSLSFAATLAGIGFGNTGTHVPHAMSYGITHLMRDVTTEGYNVPAPFVPHGISVIVNAPSIFNYTASGAPERHLQAARWLGADAQGAADADAGEVLSKRLIELMRLTGMPNGLTGLGFTEADVVPMSQSSVRQARALLNCSQDVDIVDIENMYRGALRYW